MDSRRKKEIREQFGVYLKNHREMVLQIPSIRQLSFSSNLDNSKLTKIEKGLINIEFDTLIEIAITYKIDRKKLLGFDLGLKDEESE